MRIVVALLGCAVAAAGASAYRAEDARQSYGRWHYNSAKKYYYREYVYKPKKADTAYRKQYVVYYKDDARKKNWVYMYNPQTKKYWCRYPTVNHPSYGEQVRMGKELWSVLPKDKQYGDLEMISEKSYGKVGATCPVIPGSDDKEPMEVPPPDLP